MAKTHKYEMLLLIYAPNRDPYRYFDPPCNPTAWFTLVSWVLIINKFKYEFERSIEHIRVRLSSFELARRNLIYSL